MIKLYDGGPVFYKQERLTYNHKVFMIYKFRSMRVDSEKTGAQLAKKNDDRITPVGHVIRSLHIDELPQLFNILKGDMAFVVRVRSALRLQNCIRRVFRSLISV